MQVGEFRHDEKNARSANISTNGQKQIIAAAPWIQDIDNITDEEIQANIKFARKSPQALKAREILEVGKKELDDYKLQQFEVLKAKKVELVLKKKDCLRKCKENHGGPVTSRVELEALLDKSKTDNKEMFKILQLEIFYMRDNTYDNHIMVDMTGQFLRSSKRMTLVRSTQSPLMS